MNGDRGEMPGDDLRELMVRHQGGDEAAFEKIYGRMARAVRGYLRTLILPRADVEDLVQTTFLQRHHLRRSPRHLLVWHLGATVAMAAIGALTGSFWPRGGRGER